MKFHVFADETRPLLQGSRITAYELQENGIPVTVICDNMAATVMQRGKSAGGDRRHRSRRRQRRRRQQDRHAGRGDPRAAFRDSVLRGRADQQHRSVACDRRANPHRAARCREITEGLGEQTAPADVDVYNPAFDVTPADLVTAIITENGVARALFTEPAANVQREIRLMSDGPLTPGNARQPPGANAKPARGR